LLGESSREERGLLFLLPSLLLLPCVLPNPPPTLSNPKLCAPTSRDSIPLLPLDGNALSSLVLKRSLAVSMSKADESYVPRNFAIGTFTFSILEPHLLDFSSFDTPPPTHRTPPPPPPPHTHTRKSFFLFLFKVNQVSSLASNFHTLDIGSGLKSQRMKEQKKYHLTGLPLYVCPLPYYE